MLNKFDDRVSTLYASTSSILKSKKFKDLEFKGLINFKGAHNNRDLLGKINNLRNHGVQDTLRYNLQQISNLLEKPVSFKISIRPEKFQNKEYSTMFVD